MATRIVVTRATEVVLWLRLSFVGDSTQFLALLTLLILGTVGLQASPNSESCRTMMHEQTLKNMVRGWFVGNFEPTAFQTEACEVACKTYVAGDNETRHYHKISTEITLIVSGRVRMNGIERNSGDIVLVKPFESTDFDVLEDSTTVVVKVPSAINDKYPGFPQAAE